MTKPKQTRRRTAYHEAGHAFIAWRQHVRIKRVTIKPHGEMLGSVTKIFSGKEGRDLEARDITLNVRDKIEKHIRVSLAGWEAERRFDRTASESWSICDYGDALDYMMRLAGSQREIDLYFALLRYQTKEMLRSGWPQVKALAAALLERETLRGNEIVAVIHKSLGIPQW
jgi:ATP-dependent Zn protease